MASLTKSEQQQRLENLLLAGNLYKNHQIHKETVKLRETTEQGFKDLKIGFNNVNRNIVALGIKMDEQNQRSRQQEYERKLKEQAEIREKNRIKAVNQIIFVVGEELDEIEKYLKSSKKKNNLELYFKILSLNAELQSNDVSPESFDSQSEKKEVSNLTKKINTYADSFKKKLTKNELKDLDKIMDILEVNEEAEIDKLNSTVLAQAEKANKNKKDYINACLKTACGEVLYFFPTDSSRTGLLFKIGQLKIKNTKYKIGMNHDLKERLARFWPSARKPEIANVWYTSFVKDLVKEYSVLELMKIRSILIEWINKYSKGAKWANTGVVGGLKSLLGKKKTDQDVWDDFKNKNKKIFEKIEKILPKMIDNSYLHIREDRQKELVKINQLKNSINKEKKEVDEIYKRHTFVKTIVKSRA